MAITITIMVHQLIVLFFTREDEGTEYKLVMFYAEDIDKYVKDPSGPGLAKAAQHVTKLLEALKVWYGKEFQYMRIPCHTSDGDGNDTDDGDGDVMEGDG